jgi:hypothetical protein
MLYLLTPAMYPRFLITLNETLENYPVTVLAGHFISGCGTFIYISIWHWSFYPVQVAQFRKASLQETFVFVKMISLSVLP